MTGTPAAPLTMIGGAAASCEGDFCDVPIGVERAIDDTAEVDRLEARADQLEP